jgi:hypothetical protein
MITIDNIKFTIPSNTSSGSVLVFQLSVNGEIGVEIDSTGYDGKTPRTDVRVDPEDLKDALKAILALNEARKVKIE